MGFKTNYKRTALPRIQRSIRKHLKYYNNVVIWYKEHEDDKGIPTMPNGGNEIPNTL